ncbi:MAG: hypothetical protein NT077_02885 [Candidatus Taylorbacteria bacterium]|nr:hypothetical protein [Candidatus Taylorbacteria bacterium]
MNTKILSSQALKVIDDYMHFHVGNAVSSVPYFNNKTARARMTLRARVGKGSPKDILEELESVIVKHHIVADTLADESLKKLLVENNLGVDCSAFAYYVLDAENRERGQGHLNRRILFMNNFNPIGKMKCYLRPVENCDVKTFGSDNNSRVIPLKNVQPGDIITMLEGPDASDRNHILVVHEVEYDNGIPKSVFYSHAIAYPEEGLYGNGIKQGKIEITYPDQELTKQIWTEDGSILKAQKIFSQAQASKTELRRLKWLS